MPVRKMYVLDTSVLLSDPKALFAFAEHDVLLPLVVIKELEAKRNDPTLGFPARTALRALEELRNAPGANLREGITLNDLGGTVRIEINHVDQSGLPDAMRDDRSHDTRILAVANAFALEGRDVVVVSKDLPMRILAEVLGLTAQEYRNEMVVVDRAYTGIVEIEAEQSLIDGLYAAGKSDRAALTVSDDPEGMLEGLDAFAELADDGEIDIDGPLTEPDGTTIPTNTAVRLLGPRSTGLAIVGANKSLRKVNEKREVFGITPRSVEQTVAMDHLMNPDIGVVSLGGSAGTGKSYVALAAGLEQVMESGRYNKVMIFRPLYAVGGQELGYLPGSADEKMSPWAAAVYDALEAMVGKNVRDEVAAREILEVLPLTHIRGRTLSNTFVIIDEAQSLERSVLLTALSRLGENSKAVLSWDAMQRDNLRVGRYDGVAAIVERLKGEPLFAHTTFTKTERGPVAAMVTRMLDDMIA